MARSTFQLFEQGKNVPVSIAVLIEFDLVFDSVPGDVEPLVIERLEKVIEGMHLEGAHGILIVGRYEDDVRRRCWTERLEHVEAAQLRHLNVEKDEVGL